VSALLGASCVAFAGAPDVRAWERLADTELAQRHFVEAEEAYRAAVRLGASDEDPNLSRLAGLRAWLGRCSASEPRLALLSSVHRADFTTALPLLEAAVASAPKEGCHATTLHQALAFARWLEGRDDDAQRLVSDAAKLRCRARRDDPLEVALDALNTAWRFPQKQAVMDARAAKALGSPLHPLLAAAQAKRAGRALPAVVACSDVLDVHDQLRLLEAGDRAFAKKRWADAERWYRDALALRVGTELDPSLSRLAASLAAQGQCAVQGDETLDALLALQRGSLARARPTLEAAVKASPHEGCHPTLMHHALAFSAWLEGHEEVARATLAAAESLTCRPVVFDRLESGLAALNDAWLRPDARAAHVKRAIESLGPRHPLVLLSAAKLAGRPLPTFGDCD
jgi:tetratricopeptide (TPR) repeat protein